MNELEHPAQQDCVVPSDWLPWIVAEASARGLDLCGVEDAEGGCWRVCSPRALLGCAMTLGCNARISQRPACGGFRTVLWIDAHEGPLGAWLPTVRPEPRAWRLLLLEALVLAGRSGCSGRAPTAGGRA